MSGSDPAFPSDVFAVHKDLPRDTIIKLSQSQGMSKAVQSLSERREI